MHTNFPRTLYLLWLTIKEITANVALLDKSIKFPSKLNFSSICCIIFSKARHCLFPCSFSSFYYHLQFIWSTLFPPFQKMPLDNKRKSIFALWLYIVAWPALQIFDTIDKRDKTGLNGTKLRYAGIKLGFQNIKPDKARV